jgi:signal transduction histidine kinase
LTVQKCPDGYEIAIADSGIGIPEADLPRVFDLFTQVNRPQHGAEGGLGIGLALVKHLIDLHCGHVAAASPGALGGTTITLSLPATASCRACVPGSHSDRLAEPPPAFVTD